MAKKYYWLKLMKDFFQQPKMKKLRRIAGGDTYTVIYLKLQLLSLENGGQLQYEGIEDDFAEEVALTIDEDVDNVRFVLLYLQQQGLIEEISEGEYLLPEAAKCIGSEVDSAERVRRFRDKQKALVQPTTPKALHSNSDVTTCNTEIEIEEEIDKDKRKREKTDYQLIADMYNSICTSFPALRSLSDSRKKAIAARLKTYTVEDFRTVFENAQASSFLRGGNDRNWTANFDWLIKDSNMAKVLDGNYRDKKTAKTTPVGRINRDDYENGTQVPW